MKIDRKFFENASKPVRDDLEIREAVENEEWARAISRVREKYENKPEHYLNLESIRKSEKIDRKITWREVLEKIFGHIEFFKSKNDLLEEECEKFISIHKPDSKYIPFIKNFLKAYVSDSVFRDIIDNKKFTDLNVYAGFSLPEYKALNSWREVIPAYVKDYIQIETYAA